MAPRLGSPQVTGLVNRHSNFSTYLYFFSHFWEPENKFYSEKLKSTLEKKFDFIKNFFPMQLKQIVVFQQFWSFHSPNKLSSFLNLSTKANFTDEFEKIFLLICPDSLELRYSLMEFQ